MPIGKTPIEYEDVTSLLNEHEANQFQETHSTSAARSMCDNVGIPKGSTKLGLLNSWSFRLINRLSD